VGDVVRHEQGLRLGYILHRPTMQDTCRSILPLYLSQVPYVADE